MLIKRLKKPLVSTSANISGMPSPTSFGSVSDAVKTGVDYIVEHRQDEVSDATPSQILKIKEDGQFIFIRK